MQDAAKIHMEENTLIPYLNKFLFSNYDCDRSKFIIFADVCIERHKGFVWVTTHVIKFHAFYVTNRRVLLIPSSGISGLESWLSSLAGGSELLIYAALWKAKKDFAKERLSQIDLSKITRVEHKEGFILPLNSLIDFKLKKGSTVV